jgi:hypothetical protein
MGSPITEERNLYAALNNCAFVSTKDMWNHGVSPSEPFTFLMEASMLGLVFRKLNDFWELTILKDRSWIRCQRCVICSAPTY